MVARQAACRIATWLVSCSPAQERLPTPERARLTAKLGGLPASADCNRRCSDRGSPVGAPVAHLPPSVPHAAVAADHALHLIRGVAHLVHLDLVRLEDASTLQHRPVPISLSPLTSDWATKQPRLVCCWCDGADWVDVPHQGWGQHVLHFRVWRPQHYTAADVQLLRCSRQQPPAASCLIVLLP